MRGAEVWFGSFASVEPCPRHVGFAPDSKGIVAAQRNDAQVRS